LISQHHKCIFIHVPKTGGTSIEDFFARELRLPDEDRGSLLVGPNPDPNRGPRRLSHLTAEDFLKFGYVTQDLFDAYFKFGFVRNPWDRVVSIYKYLRIGGDFKKFACDVLPNSLWTSYYGYFVRPQYDFLYDDSGRCLVDFVGRFETIVEDFDKVRKRLHLKGALPHKNQLFSPQITMKGRLGHAALGVRALNLAHVVGAFGPKDVRGSPKEYFDAESVAVVGEIYKDDVSAFGYHFEDFGNLA
jgi:hypothetical protein